MQSSTGQAQTPGGGSSVSIFSSFPRRTSPTPAMVLGSLARQVVAAAVSKHSMRCVGVTLGGSVEASGEAYIPAVMILYVGVPKVG